MSCRTVDPKTFASSETSNSWTWGEMLSVQTSFYIRGCQEINFTPWGHVFLSWICFFRCFLTDSTMVFITIFNHHVGADFCPTNFRPHHGRNRKSKFCWGHLPPEQLYQRCQNLVGWAVPVYLSFVFMVSSFNVWDETHGMKFMGWNNDEIYGRRHLLHIIIWDENHYLVI